jgi:hypothetical protein
MACNCCKTGSNCRRYNYALFGCGQHYGKGYCAPSSKFTELDPLEFDLDFTFTAAPGFDLSEFGIPATVSRKGYNYRGPGWGGYHESNGIYTEDFGTPHNGYCGTFEATPGRLKIYLEILQRAPVTTGGPPVFWIQERTNYFRNEIFREGSWVCCFIPERFRNYTNTFYRNLNFRGIVGLDSIICDPLDFTLSGQLRMDLGNPVSVVTVANFTVRVRNAKKWEFPGSTFWTQPVANNFYGPATWTLTTCRHAPYYLNPSDTPQIPVNGGPSWFPTATEYPGDERGLCPDLVDTTRHTKWRACVTWTEFSGSYLPTGVANGFSLDMSTCTLSASNPAEYPLTTTLRTCDYEGEFFYGPGDWHHNGPDWITGTNRPSTQEGQPNYGTSGTGTDIELKVDASRPKFGFSTDPMAGFDENMVVSGSFSSTSPSLKEFQIGGVDNVGYPSYYAARPSRPIQIESTTCNQGGVVFQVVFKDVPVRQLFRGWGSSFVGYLRVRLDLIEYTPKGSCDRVTVTPPTCPAGPPPPPPTPTTKYWCVNGSCVSGTTAPTGTTSGPYATASECSSNCQAIPTTALWYCSNGFCVQATTPPPGALVGYSTESACRASCSSIPPAQGSWWCVPAQNGCVQSFSQPTGATSGPHARKVDCDFGCVPPPPTIPYWCGSSGCVQSWTRPEGSSGVSYSTLASCQAGCNPTPSPYPGFYCVPVTNPTAEAPGPFTCISWGGQSGPPVNSQGGKYSTLQDCVNSCGSGTPYWCVTNPAGGLNQCVQATTAPAGTVSGPYATSTICFENCNLSVEPSEALGPDPVPQALDSKDQEVRARYSLPCVHRGDPVPNSGFT